MKEVLQKNGKRLNKKQYVIFAIIIIVILANVFYSELSGVAVKKIWHCQGSIVNLFKGYDENCKSYVEYLNTNLEILDRDLNSAEKYKIFLSSEDRTKLSQFREFYNSFPKEEVETLLFKCELLRTQLQVNTKNIEKLSNIDATERENIEEISEALTIYKHGINESKEKLADILKCDIGDINEYKFNFLETAEEVVSNPNTFYGDGEPDYELIGWSLELHSAKVRASLSTTRFGESDDDTIEEIRDYFKNNVEFLLSDEEDLFFGKIPDAVVYEECREILEETNIDFVR